MSNTTYLVQYECYYGIIDEIKEGYFGGVRPLKYVDLDGKAPECDKYDNPQKVDTQGGRIIQGIGITEWNDGECLFGPPDPYDLISMESMYNEYSERHYRSMLVHFERNGEVLYDVWPESSPQMAYRPFVEDGKVWKLGDTGSYPVQRVSYYYFDGDTIIDGKTCKQMMRREYISPEHPNYDYLSQQPSLYYVGAWYEEDKKVYEYDTTDKQFRLMYDFSLEANGIFEINYPPYVFLYRIGPRQTGGIEGFKGVYRDVLPLNDESWYKCSPWLEGVGVIYAAPTISINILEEPSCFLISCTVGEEVIYLKDGVEDVATPAEARKHRFDFTHTTKIQPKARKNSDEAPLYGEYNDHQLCINLDPLDDTYLVRIADESGKAVYEREINAGNIVGLNIDISAYPEGRYTVTVENSQESFTGEFEAQTTGIVEVRRNTEEIRGYIYNLQGQRLSSLKKGLNIVNGQKVYVK